MLQSAYDRDIDHPIAEIVGARFSRKTRAAKTNPTEVLRKAAANYVREDPTARNAIVEHIRARAGTWDGDISGVELLRRTRP